MLPHFNFGQLLKVFKNILHQSMYASTLCDDYISYRAHLFLDSSSICCFRMILSRSMHKLAYYTYNICDIWSCQRQIYEASHKLLISIYIYKSLTCYLLSRWLDSIGLAQVLHPNILDSFNKSNTYFLWERKIPYFDFVTSIPRKYFSEQTSVISNCLAKLPLRLTIFVSSFLVTTISSTYTLSVVTLCPCLFTKSVWFV